MLRLHRREHDEFEVFVHVCLNDTGSARSYVGRRDGLGSAVAQDRGVGGGGRREREEARGIGLKLGPTFQHFSSTASAARLWDLLSETQEGGAGE